MSNDNFFDNNVVNEIDVKALKELIDNQKEFVLVDVRTIEERKAALIHPDIHIPLDEFSQKYDCLPKGKNIILYCRSGIRSHQAARFLSSMNYENVSNLSGGIVMWAKEIDPKLKPI